MNKKHIPKKVESNTDSTFFITFSQNVKNF